MCRKAILRLSLAVVVTVVAVSCGSGGGKRPSESGARRGRVIALTDSALMAGARDTIGFGNLSSGEIAEKEVWLENRTSRPLVISQVKKNCGCVSFEYAAEPLLQGESRKIKITFDSRGEWGWQLKVADLCFPGFEKGLRLYVDADIR